MKIVFEGWACHFCHIVAHPEYPVIVFGIDEEGICYSSNNLAVCENCIIEFFRKIKAG